MPYNSRSKPHKKKPNHSKDRKKLAVMAYLGSIYPSAATKNNIAKKAKIRAQEGRDFTNLMDELVSIGWVVKKIPETVNGPEPYNMTEEGRIALGDAKDLVRRESPLASLDVFKDVLSPE